jgi:Fungal Zn(2)-Cys(6) binuclear cluster domain
MPEHISGKATAESPRADVASSSPSEKSATLAKLRSCVVCRTRRVRCDRGSPCSNCRRGNIACVYPSAVRPPRWARRLERVANDAVSKAPASQDPDPAAAQVLKRLQHLESLVKELSGQLEQASAAASRAAAGASGVESDSFHARGSQQESETLPGIEFGSIHNQFGRLMQQDVNQSRYVSSGFWSRVNDEVCQCVAQDASVFQAKLTSIA